MTPRTPTIFWVASRNGAAIIDEPESEKSLFSEPMKMRTPSPPSARGEEVDHVGLGLEIGEEQADALEILGRAEVLEEVGLAAYDQLPGIRGTATGVASPASTSRGGQRVELALHLLARVCDLPLELGRRSGPGYGR